MATVVIGGQASGVGKTGLICALMAAMPERRWTAIKVTQCSHRTTQGSGQAGEGKRCDCGLDGRGLAISEEMGDAVPPWRSLSGAPVDDYQTDTARYLAAGAVRSIWARTLPGHLAEAMPQIQQEIRRGGNVVIESNSVMEFLRPEVYALIVSPDVEDFKASARRYLDRADAILTVVPLSVQESPWPKEVETRMRQAPQFSVDALGYISPEFFALVRRRLDAMI
jgi:hypothetical protein